MQLYLSFLIAIFLTSLGTFLIFYFWKQRKSKPNHSSDKHINLGVSVGWFLVFSSIFAFDHTKGIEFGLTYLFLFLAIAAWLIMFILNLKHAEPNKSQKPYKNQFIEFKRSIKSFSTFFIAGPLALTSSCLASILICSYLPIQQADALVLAGFLLPIVWALTSYWMCATSKRLVPTSVVTLSGLVSGLIIFNV